MTEVGGEEERLRKLEALYRAEYERAVRLAFLLVGDRSVAEELVQEAFVRVFPRVADLDQPGGYLRITLVNLSRDHHRRRATERRHPPIAHGDVDSPGVPRSVSEIWLALQQLPDRQREVLVLRYYADLSTEEIARLLDARAGTVRSLIHRGLVTLKGVLEHD